MDDKMSKNAVEIRAEMIAKMIAAGFTEKDIEENLNVMNILCQVFSDLEN